MEDMGTDELQAAVSIILRHRFSPFVDQHDLQTDLLRFFLRPVEHASRLTQLGQHLLHERDCPVLEDCARTEAGHEFTAERY
jgi:hypothetical protein